MAFLNRAWCCFRRCGNARRTGAFIVAIVDLAFFARAKDSLRFVGAIRFLGEIVFLAADRRAFAAFLILPYLFVACVRIQELDARIFKALQKTLRILPRKSSLPGSPNISG
jgi:hypothetical protein